MLWKVVGSSIKYKQLTVNEQCVQKSTDSASDYPVLCLILPEAQVYFREHGSNVSPGPAAVGDKPVSIRSIVMITTEIKHPTWHRLSIPQTAAFGVPVMSVRAGMSTLRGNSHFDDVSSICLKFFFSVPFFFLALLLLGLQKLPVLSHSNILLS